MGWGEESEYEPATSSHGPNSSGSELKDQTALELDAWLGGKGEGHHSSWHLCFRDRDGDCLTHCLQSAFPLSHFFLF